jgi:hypothetical protein
MLLTIEISSIVHYCFNKNQNELIKKKINCSYMALRNFTYLPFFAANLNTSGIL